MKYGCTRRRSLLFFAEVLCPRSPTFWPSCSEGGKQTSLVFLPMISQASVFTDSVTLHRDYLLAIVPSLLQSWLCVDFATTFWAAREEVGPRVSIHSLYTMVIDLDQLLGA